MPLAVGVDAHLSRQAADVERRADLHVLLGTVVDDGPRLSAVHTQSEPLVVQQELDGVRPAVPDHLVTAGSAGDGEVTTVSAGDIVMVGRVRSGQVRSVEV